jgi:PhnB protein
MAKVKPIPEGYHAVTPYLITNNAAAAIDFYKRAFGATEVMRMPAPGGKVGHAELMIGDSKIMLADEYPEMNAHSPRHYGGSPVSLHVYVEDVDSLAKRAELAGAKIVSAVEDKFYGDRLGTLEDPFGHVWHISTHVEDLTPEEIGKRAEAFGKKKQA